MAAENVGQVSIDVLLNNRDFTKQVNKSCTQASNIINNKMGSTISKIGKLAAAAFSVKAIVNFSKSCLELGSDLQEVQNVVDSTFTTMSDKVDEYSKQSITQLGMSETSYKRYIGTLGAMSKSFGFTESEALSMSKTLTELTGDVASFYNLSHDEAYTKLKAVFTGETESLKELGVVMTQTALDSFALAKGYGKTTKQMTEQEKVALRYAFVQDKLSTATGDFTRTQNGWANQTRILNQQWSAFKSNIGQALINALTPAIKSINMLMQKLIQLSGTLKQFSENIFGNAGGSSGAAVEQLGEVSDNTASAVEGIGDAGANAAKKIQKSFSGLDEITTLSAQQDDESLGAMISSEETISNIKEETKATDNLGKTIDKLKSKLKEIQELFKAFDNNHFGGSISNLGKSFANLGKTLFDSSVKIGKSLGEGIKDGIIKFVESDGQFIKDKLKSIMDIQTETNDIWSNIARNITDILTSVFSSEHFSNIIANLLEIFTNFGLKVVETLFKLKRDIDSGIDIIISDNKEKIIGFYNSILSLIDGFTTTIKDILNYVGEAWTKLYDEHIGPFIKTFSEGMSSIVGTFLDVWENNIFPILEAAKDEFNKFYENSFKPFVDNMSEKIGHFIDVLGELWKEVLVPLINWIITNILPVVTKVIGDIWKCILKLSDDIGTIIEGLMDILNGIIDFIVGVFTGDWEQAWNGIKEIFDGVIQAIMGLVDGLIDGIMGIVSGVKDLFVGLKEAYENSWLSKPAKEIIGDTVKGIAGAAKNDKTDTISQKTKDATSKSAMSYIGDRINKYATGGYIAANQPQLAIVGDNRTQGEIISPEDKMAEVFASVLSKYFGEGQGGANTNINNIITIDGKTIYSEMKNYSSSENSRQGVRQFR